MDSGAVAHLIDMLGPYDLLGPLDQGGMATVWCAKRRGESPPLYDVGVFFDRLPRATQEALDRYVMVKLALTGS